MISWRAPRDMPTQPTVSLGLFQHEREKKRDIQSDFTTLCVLSYLIAQRHWSRKGLKFFWLNGGSLKTTKFRNKKKGDQLLGPFLYLSHSDAFSGEEREDQLEDERGTVDDVLSAMKLGNDDGHKWDASSMMRKSKGIFAAFIEFSRMSVGSLLRTFDDAFFSRSSRRKLLTLHKFSCGWVRVNLFCVPSTYRLGNWKGKESEKLLPSSWWSASLVLSIFHISHTLERREHNKNLHSRLW